MNLIASAGESRLIHCQPRNQNYLMTAYGRNVGRIRRSRRIRQSCWDGHTKCTFSAVIIICCCADPAPWPDGSRSPDGRPGSPAKTHDRLPFPHAELSAVLAGYPELKEVMWVQDEPENQGGWLQLLRPIYDCMQPGQKLSFSSRPASSSPAVGYFQKHTAQQKELVNAAFGTMPDMVIVR